MRGRQRSRASVCLLTLCISTLSACATESARSGESCTRSAQCAAGLACIAGECSADVDAVGQQNDVPMLMPEVADGAAGDGSDGTIDGGPLADDAG